MIGIFGSTLVRSDTRLLSPSIGMLVVVVVNCPRPSLSRFVTNYHHHSSWYKKCLIVNYIGNNVFKQFQPCILSFIAEKKYCYHLLVDNPLSPVKWRFSIITAQFDYLVFFFVCVWIFQLHFYDKFLVTYAYIVVFLDWIYLGYLVVEEKYCSNTSFIQKKYSAISQYFLWNIFQHLCI